MPLVPSWAAVTVCVLFTLLAPHRTATGLLAAVRERRGRIDEAIALLRARESADGHVCDLLADLLARHGRIDDLRARATVDPAGPAGWRLARLLEEFGDEAGAAAVYRAASELPCGGRGMALGRARLLARCGRGEEAMVVVVRACAESTDGAECCIVSTLCTLYADHGRPHEGLAFLDGLIVRQMWSDDEELLQLRLPLMVAAGQLDEAIELVRDRHPDGDRPFLVEAIAKLIAKLLAERPDLYRLFKPFKP
ncbi:hypothetical protein [Kitasatospora sp. CB01950]|uniref:hypothetical protein n=1 Tax=Kitasatospora sp. CB01950 TaxID=1703930 RepID=UPI0013011847|nr:hypothetical protein [Kitasatospora sp. CB01950]